MSCFDAISHKIENKSARIGIVGLGYVGLPLAMLFSKYFNVIGYDIDERKINQLKSGESYIIDVARDEVQEALNKSFLPTSEFKELERCDFIILCVPTPLTVENDPDLSYINNSCLRIAEILSPGMFIILESTTYPGTTNGVVNPILERSGFKAGLDFGLAYSPERVDPGNKNYKISMIPKIVGGINEECTEIASQLYQCIIRDVIKVSNAKTAEAVKMLENIFRHVNIALINELSLIFDKMEINTWEVIEAAKTKPYGFMPFYPGPGVGGHCIPLDPYYMSYIAKRHDFLPKFIEMAGEMNDFMKTHTVNLVDEGLRKVGKSIHGSKLAIFGMAYKKNIDDVRESPCIKIIEMLVNLGAQIKIYDPYVKSVKTSVGILSSEKCIDDALQDIDCALFLIDHDEFRDLRTIDRIKCIRPSVVIDCKNLFNRMDDCIYMGIGRGDTCNEKASLCISPSDI